MPTLDEREAKVKARKDDLELRSLDAPEEPCGRCGTRADVGCRHRPARGPRPIAIATSATPDGRRRRDYTGQGWNFHVQKGGR